MLKRKYNYLIVILVVVMVIEIFAIGTTVSASVFEIQEYAKGLYRVVYRGNQVRDIDVHLANIKVDVINNNIKVKDADIANVQPLVKEETVSKQTDSSLVTQPQEQPSSVVIINPPNSIPVREVSGSNPPDNISNEALPDNNVVSQPLSAPVQTDGSITNSSGIIEIFFGINSSHISDSELDKIVNNIGNLHNKSITLKGYGCSRGSKKINIKVASARIESVKSALLGNGIVIYNTEVVGKVMEGNVEHNRRVDIVY